jgi:two-component system chemotaxis response regulator CheB
MIVLIVEEDVNLRRELKLRVGRLPNVLSIIGLPGFEQAISFMEKDKVDIVLVSKYSKDPVFSKSIEKISSLNPKIQVWTVEDLPGPSESPKPDKSPKVTKPTLSNIDLILIGSSTGGPGALKKVFEALPKAPAVPVMMVQHMPENFTKDLAETLSKEFNQEVIEAQDMAELRPGVFYLAPGNYHLILRKIGEKKLAGLDQGPKVCSVRPAFDVLLNSVSFSNLNVLLIVLTGMGEDGLRGVQTIPIHRRIVAIQDQQSSVVWGMPGQIYNHGLADKVCTLDEIAGLINNAGRGHV